MSDRPWLENPDPSLRSERELLKRLNAEQPPAGSVDQGWSALAAEIAVIQAVGVAASGASATTHAAPAAAGTMTLGLPAKVLLGVALAGGALWGGNQLLAPAPKASSSRPPVAAPAEPRPAPVSLAPAPEAPVEAAPEGVHSQPAPARPGSSSTTLAEEGRMLAKAHQLVQSGQGQQALEVLRQSEARYPRSVLSQEREVLTIEAYGASGASGVARARAERFLKRYPSSPHTRRLARFVE